MTTCNGFGVAFLDSVDHNTGEVLSVDKDAWTAMIFSLYPDLNKQKGMYLLALFVHHILHQ